MTIYLVYWQTNNDKKVSFLNTFNTRNAVSFLSFWTSIRMVLENFDLPFSKMEFVLLGAYVYIYKYTHAAILMLLP
jgi:hypothetical protein